MKTTKPQIYNLNLSARYAPNWGAWEIVREVVCNAMDADPNNLEIVFVGPNDMQVQTETCPELKELLILGSGSKSTEDKNIGQFGEGLKLAALAATRLGSIELIGGGQKITFGFREYLGENVLHAFSEPCDQNGFTVKVSAPGVLKASKNKFLLNAEYGPIKKTNDQDPHCMRIYNKGVFVCELQENSLFDWNLEDLEINRDRSLVSTWSIASGIREWFIKNHQDNKELLSLVVSSKEVFESETALDHCYDTGLSLALVTTFEDLYTKDAVLCSDDSRINEIALNQGKKVIYKISGAIRNTLSRFIRSAEDEAGSLWDFDIVDSTPYLDKIKELQNLNAVVGAPIFTTCVFANRSDNVYGKADLSELKILLNQSLFLEGNEILLYGTYLHEVAHLISQSMDITRNFEQTLTDLLGRITYVYLEKSDGN